MNILTIRLRSLGRRLGIHRLVYNIRARLNPDRSYEDRCSKALQDTILPGDVVWDIGANVGFYTGKFCDLVGPHGHVIAFDILSFISRVIVHTERSFVIDGDRLIRTDRTGRAHKI